MLETERLILRRWKDLYESMCGYLLDSRYLCGAQRYF